MTDTSAEAIAAEAAWLRHYAKRYDPITEYGIRLNRAATALEALARDNAKLQAGLFVEYHAGDHFETSADEWRARAESAEARLAEVDAGADIFRKALERILAEAESDDGATAWDGGDIAREAIATALAAPEEENDG